MSGKTIDKLALASAILMGLVLLEFLANSMVLLLYQVPWLVKLFRSVPREAYFLIGVGAYGLSFIFGLIASSHMFRKEHRFRWKPFLLILPVCIFTLYVCVGLVCVLLNQK